MSSSLIPPPVVVVPLHRCYVLLCVCSMLRWTLNAGHHGQNWGWLTTLWAPLHLWMLNRPVLRTTILATISFIFKLIIGNYRSLSISNLHVLHIDNQRNIPGKKLASYLLCKFGHVSCARVTGRWVWLSLTRKAVGCGPIHTRIVGW